MTVDNDPNRQYASPIGVVGAVADRDRSGRFTTGNKAALVVGARSSAFWAGVNDVRVSMRDAILRDAGCTDDATQVLSTLADGLVQASLVRDAAFQRLVESGGPTTTHGRTRRAFQVWLSSLDRCERLARLIGINRKARPVEDAFDVIASLNASGSRPQAAQAGASDPNDEQDGADVQA
jgi:hypothetical protein